MKNKNKRFKGLILKAAAGILSGLIIIAVTGYAIDSKQRADFVRKTNAGMLSHDLDINLSAPTVAKREIVINAPIEQVWSKLTSINEWTKWQSSITSAEIDSAPEKGASFRWTSGGIPFHSTIHTSKRLESFGWTGTTLGAQAIHNWHFTREGDKTKVSVEESLQGLLVRLFAGYFQDNLNTGMQTSLEELRRSCEE